MKIFTTSIFKVLTCVFAIASLLNMESTAQVQQMPYSEDFESLSTCPTTCGAACVLTNGWTNDLSDDIDWTVDVGGTGSGSTGPALDHNPGTSTGNYLYTETSGCNGDTANLISPPVSLVGALNPFVSYWYHMYGATMGSFHIDISNDGGATWSLDITPSVAGNMGDVWLNNTINLSAWIGDTVQVRFRAITGTSFTSDNAIDDVTFFQILPVDAGISSIDAPVTPVTPGMASVQSTITNFGTDTLMDATIGWSVDGVAGTPYSWTGSLTTNTSSGPNNLGMYNFTSGFHTIKSWTESPNMSTDQQLGNDTMTVSVLACAPLSGIYSLGSQGSDFQNFAEATLALEACGVSGPVTIDIAAGTYMETVSLGAISGSSAINTVTFEGGDTSLVKVTWTGGPTIALSGASYITFNDITIETSGTIDSYGVQLNDTAVGNSISNCRIVMPNGTGSSFSDVIGVSASGTVASSFTEGQNALYTTVTNCVISGGEKGIHFEGQSALRNVGNTFTNNHIYGVEDYGFYIDDQDSIVIRGNTIEGLISNFADGIYCFDIQMFDISGNKAMDVPDWAIYIADGNFTLDGTPASRGLVSNNMVSSLTDYAMYFDDFELTDVYHNTAYGNPGIRVNDIDRVNIINNIFVSDNDFAFESDDALNATTNTVDYNLYWTPPSNTNFIDEGLNVESSLVFWKASSPSLNSKSVEGDPFFLNGQSDMHVLGLAANDVGDNSVSILEDIDGDVRPASGSTIVDIGADEYTPRQNDAVLNSLVAPSSLACGDSITMISISITNQGLDTITNLPVTINVSGDITSTFNVTYTGPLAFGMTDIFIVGTINTYGGANIAIDGFVTLAGDADTTNNLLAAVNAEFIPQVPQVNNGLSICGADSALVTVNPWSATTYGFFASPTDSVPVAVGNSFMVPSISTQGTYYVEALNNKDSLLLTTAAGNGCGGGAMFDIVANSAVNVNAVSYLTNDAVGTPTSATIHYISNSSYAGNETNAGAWTTLGTYMATSNGSGVLTYIDFAGASITIPAGTTTAIYVEYNAVYTTGAVTVSNADITINAGVGLCSSFGGTNNPRSFNGVVHYGTSACSAIRVPVTAAASVGASVDLGADTVLCDGSSITLDAGNAGATYSWSTGDSVQTQVISTAGTVSVLVIDSNGCSAADSITVTTGLTPSAAFTAATSMDTVNFSDGSTGSPAISYAWDFGDGTTSSAQNPQHVYASNGTYTVCLTVTEPCGVDSTCQSVNISVGVNEIPYINNVYCFPNPTDGIFTLTANIQQQTSMEIEIFDVIGKSLYQRYEGSVNGIYNTNIDISDLPHGFYQLRITSNGHIATYKILRN